MVTDVTNQGYVEFNPKDNPGAILFGTGNSKIMRLLDNGNVGIGTIPRYKLTVQGYLYLIQERQGIIYTMEAQSLNG